MFFDENNVSLYTKKFKGKIKPPGGKLLAKAIESDDPDFVDFIKHCLIWEPEKRMTAEQALNHRWIGKSLIPQQISDSNGSNSRIENKQNSHKNKGKIEILSSEIQHALNKEKIKNLTENYATENQPQNEKLSHLKKKIKLFAVKKTLNELVEKPDRIFNKTIVVGEGNSRNNGSFIESAGKSHLQNSLVS